MVYYKKNKFAIKFTILYLNLKYKIIKLIFLFLIIFRLNILMNWLRMKIIFFMEPGNSSLLMQMKWNLKIVFKDYYKWIKKEINDYILD